MSKLGVKTVAWGMWALAIGGIATAAVLAELNPPISTTELPESTLSAVIWVSSWLGFGLVGALVVSSKPTNRIGWLMCGITFSLGATLFSSAYARYALVTSPGSLPLGQVAAWLAAWTSVVVATLAVVLVAWFPTGQATSRFGRVLLRTFLALATVDALAFAFRPGPVEGDTPPNNPLGVPGAGPLLNNVVEALGTALALVAVLIIVDLVLRYRRSGGVERLQFRWFMAAVTVFPVLFILAIVIEENVLGYGGFDPVVVAFFLCVNGSAVAIGFAITRHGLYEINRIISRTVTYGLVTTLVVAVYFGAVTLLRALLPTQGTIAVAGSTLLAAVLINPLRRRTQRSIDQRFNRAGYDRALTLERLGQRMTNEIDLDGVARELETVARTTMQPAKLSVWVR